MIDIKYTTIAEGLEKLKEGVNTRNKISDKESLFWMISDNKCLDLANKLIHDGVDKNEIAKIGDWDSDYDL